MVIVVIDIVDVLMLKWLFEVLWVMGIVVVVIFNLVLD